MYKLSLRRQDVVSVLKCVTPSSESRVSLLGSVKELESTILSLLAVDGHVVGLYVPQGIDCPSVTSL
jgi:hypothetical protein